MDRNGCIAVYHKKVCFHKVYNYDEEEICIVSSLSAWFFFCFLSIKSRRYDILSYWHGTKTLFWGGGQYKITVQKIYIPGLNCKKMIIPT